MTAPKRKASPAAGSQLVPAMPEPTKTATQTGGAEQGASSALKGMSVRSLRQRARELGVPESELTVAVEGNDPKQQLIKLIQANTGHP